MALILLMGPPSAGKSTLRHRLSSAHPELIESTSFDDFRKNQQTRPIENSQNSNLFDMETRSIDNSNSARENRKAFQCHVDSTVSQNSSNFKNSNQKIYLIEDIFYMKSMRRPFSKIAKRHHLEFGVVLLKCTSSEAIRRNSTRNPDEKQKEETILKIFENLEIPDSGENWIVLEQKEALEIGLEEILERLEIRIQDSEKGEEEILEDSRIVKKNLTSSSSTPSELQYLDVITRRLVSELIQNDRSLDGRKMSQARKLLITSDFDSNCDLKRILMDFYDKIC